jgi:hypothetical protein
MAEEVDKTLHWISARKSESEQDRKAYETRWARNMKLSKGIPLEDKSTRSEVRGRNKIYFRKIWAISWRLVAAFYNAFLRDSQNFKITGIDTIDDPRKAAVLFSLMKYRYRQMMRKDSLFVKHVWAFTDITNLGWCAGKLCWEYDKEIGIDRPRYISYPVEQVYPDFTADTKTDMKFCIFVNYMTKDDMNSKGYDNIEKAEAIAIPSNEVRSVRNSGTRDPLQNPGSTEYPAAGRYVDGKEDNAPKVVYAVWESFYKEKGKWQFGVSHAGKAWAKNPIESPYGDWLPLIMGICLTDPHKLIGEGFPESMEGPQESYNFNLNMRKDNVSLAMNKPTIVSRFGNVDLNALMNRGPGKAVLADDPNAVREMEVHDVTQSAYNEASQDIGMMQDVSGVVSAVEGMSNADTATESNINLSQGTAKIDLYTALVGETYFADFIAGLGYLIQRFETDEKTLRIAQDELTAGTGIDHSDVYNMDFEADYEISIGQSIGKDAELKQCFLIMDRGAMYNQQQMLLLQSNAVPPEGVKLFNGLAVLEDVMKITGKKEFQKYWVQIPPPPTPAPPQTPGEKLASSMPVDNGMMAGLNAPQPGVMANLQPPNDLQGGSMGGM